MRYRARLVVPLNLGLEPKVPIIFTCLWDRIIIIPQELSGVKVHSYLTNDFSNLKGKKAGREFWKINQTFKDSSEKFLREIIVNNAQEDFLEGTIEVLKSTGLDIYFELPEKYLQKNKEQDILKDKIIEILSYFINQYRTVANEVDVHNPSSLDLPVIELHASKKNFKTDYEVMNGQYKFHSRILSTPKPELTGYFKKKINKDIFDKLQKNLNSSLPVQIHLQLLSDAKEYAQLRGDYKTAIILSVTATEIFLQTSFLGECNFRNIKTLTREYKGVKKTVDFVEAILEADLRDNLLGDIGKQITGENIKSSKQYQEWYENAYKIRKEVIHKVKLFASEKEAKDAFVAVVNFINYISGLIVNSRK